MSMYDDPNREAVGLPPIWTGADEVAEPKTDEVTPSTVDEPWVAAFDPSVHTVAEVQQYIAEHPDQRDAVLDAEADGKARVSLLGDE